MIYIKPTIEKPYLYGNENDKEKIEQYLQELKETKGIIEKNCFELEHLGLCSSDWKRKVIKEIDEQIKLCEHYFKTIQRDDLNKWIFQENYKRYEWEEPRDIYTFSNGMVKGVIEVFHSKSTKIKYFIKNDCDLYLYFDDKESYKNLRNEESIKNYIEEIKKYLEEEIIKVEYDRTEKNFLDVIFNKKK